MTPSARIARLFCYRRAMDQRRAIIRFQARLSRPAEPEDAAWSFVVLPQAASARLPARGMVSVDGTLEGVSFQATLEPDGEGSHWLRIDEALRDAAGLDVGATITLAIATAAREPEPAVPDDLAQALAARPAALETWHATTARARRDWIQWIASGKKAGTRAKRTAVACDKLAAGQRRACCFDRSGRYSRGGIGAPQARE